MYPLTDATTHELRVLTDLVAEKMTDLNNGIAFTQKHIPEGDVLNDLIGKDYQKLTVLREWNVRLLTALQIVSSKEKISQS